MAIDFKPFEELFEPVYQLNYISLDGHIDVGPNTYSVFHSYTMEERQIIFQVCEKYLPWEYTEEQEHWERTMYMYQWVIKSPPPFPYLEYTLNEDITMAITWALTITPLNINNKEASIIAVRTDDIDGSIKAYEVSKATIDTQTMANNIWIMDEIWGKHQIAINADAAISNFVSDLEAAGKTNLEARE